MAILGLWKVASQEIDLSLENGQLLAKIRDQEGRWSQIDSKNIICGFDVNISAEPRLDSFVSRIDKLSREAITISTYPRENPTEVWIFEVSSGVAGIEASSAKTLLKKSRSQESVAKALGHLQTALKVQVSRKGNTLELEQAIDDTKKELLKLKFLNASTTYLSIPKHIDDFQEAFGGYLEEDNSLALLDEFLTTLDLSLIPNRLAAALINEEKGNLMAAAKDYVWLSEGNALALNCIDKAYLLVEMASHYDSSLQDRIKEVRLAFNESIRHLNDHVGKMPTCFICFNVDEKDVKKWLEDFLVPDLHRIGIAPIFSSHNLNPGFDVDDFQECSRYTNKVIIVCTPGLKTKCEERKDSPTGAAQEVKLIRSRFNDKELANSVVPIFLKGPRKKSLPTAYFEATFGSKFEPFKENSRMNYFCNAFDLFFALKDIPREHAGEARTAFLERVKEILKK